MTGSDAGRVVLAEFFAGKRNSVGDYWAPSMAKAAHESLLAEAEELAERNRNHWHAMKAQRDALQAQVDAVRSAFSEVETYLLDRQDVIDGPDGPLPNEEMNLLRELRAALGEK